MHASPPVGAALASGTLMTKRRCSKCSTSLTCRSYSNLQMYHAGLPAQDKESAAILGNREKVVCCLKTAQGDTLDFMNRL